ncbi:hypothetical protein [Ekhidna sp.]|uniref:hypothetical protein n=1 Tax=Ekhidna sp. TaxID=2608089 RepID=UPI003297F92F
MKNSLSIFVIFLLIISCDPCDDCDSVSFEPTISLIFINQDSIQSIDDSLAIISFNDSSLAANIDSLSILRDSLETINDSIQNGGDLNSEKMALEDWIMSRQSDSLLFVIKNLGTDTITPILNQTKASINTGLLKVDQIEILGTSNVFSYEDSATTWSIPLSYNEDFNQYEITIAGVPRLIELSYSTFQELDQERNVLIRAKDIQVVTTTFDSFDNCEENCVDGETIFTFYF